MQLARFLNSVFKKDGFILENAYSKNYIIGTPKSDKPIKIKILDKNFITNYCFSQIYILVKLILMEI